MTNEKMIFDQYSRYYGVISILQKSTIKFSSVLDVGSGPYCLLGNFLPNVKIKYLDPLLASLTLEGKDCSSKSVFELDINDHDNKKDLVVSIDTYEHIPPNKRENFIERCISLSNKAIIFAFPSSDTPHSRDLDNIIHEQYKAVYNQKYSWLKEHDEYGLPSSKELVNKFKAMGLHVASFRHGRINWLKDLLPKIILLNEYPEMLQVIYRISEKFNVNFAPNDWSEAGYRTIVIASKTPFSMEDSAGKPIRDLSQSEWDLFMDDVFIEVMKEFKDFFKKQKEDFNNILRSTESRLIGNIEERDIEINRLSKVVDDASNTIKSLCEDLGKNEQKILNLDEEITNISNK